jgi:excisionase family DNA binding protein
MKVDIERQWSDHRRTSIRFEERPTCTVAEACNAIGLGKTKFYELMGKGAVETIRVGRRRLVRVPSLLQFLNRTASDH